MTMTPVDYKDSVWWQLRSVPLRIGAWRHRSWAFTLTKFPEEGRLAAVHLTAPTTR